MYSRRSFLKSLASVGVLASTPLTTVFAGDIRVVVIGGGVAGTRAAAYLKKSMPFADIKLFDPVIIEVNVRAAYSVMQNKYRPVTKQLLDEMGVEIITDEVMHMDPTEKFVQLANGKSYKADYVVVAPGIDLKWDEVQGFEPAIEKSIMHAWQHPHAELSLWQQLESMRNGDVVIISVPKAPYRYPSGPYQRATRIAEYLKEYKAKSKLLLLDGNDVFPSMQEYRKKWKSEFPDGRLQWVPSVVGGAVDKVDFQKNTIYTAGESIKAGVLNFIPPQHASSIVRQAELNVDSDWCQVNPETMESSYYKGVYVVGDANNANTYNKTAANADKHALKCMLSINRSLV